MTESSAPSTQFRLLDWSAAERAGLGWDDVARLWNESAAGRHAFFPWRGPPLAARMDGYARFDPSLAWWALDAAGRPAGFAHGVRIAESFRATRRAVEALWVRPDARRRGAGGALLDAVLAAHAADARRRGDGEADIDAMGAWPNGPLYATLADGSERSGLFYEREPALAALFASRGFIPYRDSVVMRCALSAADADIGGRGGDLGGIWRRRLACRRPDTDYLDETFRGWPLWEHQLLNRRDAAWSRAIFGRMDGLSDHSGSEHYAVFGVNTPAGNRRGGWATLNLRLMLAEIARRGGRMVELHCHADNLPALGLYAKIGFTPVARTRAMRRRLLL